MKSRRLSTRTGVACLILGALAALGTAATGYVRNVNETFFLGVVGLGAFAAVALRVGISRPILAIPALTTLLFLVGLGAVELLLAPSSEDALPLPSRDRRILLEDRIYSFERAQADPVQFRRWWRHYVRQWSKLKHQLYSPDPSGQLPFKLRPGAAIQFFDSEIRINQHGFRGPEIETDKRTRYRIIALGESTTMGATLHRHDRPWPEILEELLNQKFGHLREIEVINAGVAAYTLQDSLGRLQQDVLPLNPDLLISYHGYNGFEFLDPALAPVRHQVEPPLFQDRPSWLLAKTEYAVRLFSFNRRLGRLVPDTQRTPALLPPPSKSPYAGLYRKLAALTAELRIPLALLSFNMAVNDRSPEQVLRFYAGGFPQVQGAVAANRMHSELLSAFRRTDPPVLVIDTSANLDGHPDKFIDLVHLTQEGRQTLATNVTSGLLSFLEGQLYAPISPKSVVDQNREVTSAPSNL